MIIKKEDFEKIIFIVAYFLMMASKMLETVIFINKYIVSIRYLSFILVFILLILYLRHKKISKKRFIFDILISLIGLTIYKVTNTNTIFILVLFALICKCIDFDSLVSYDFYIKLFLIFIVLICYKFNLTLNDVFLTTDGVIRNTLGFAKPNTLGFYLFSLSVDLIYMNRFNKKYNYLILIFVFSLISGFVAISRTSQFLLMFLLLYPLFINKEVKYKKFRLLFIVFTIFSFLIPLLYEKNYLIINCLNKFMTNRVYFSSIFISKYNIKILGQQVIAYHPLFGYELYIDNGYLRLLINYGILSYLFVYYLYMKSYKKASLSMEKSVMFILFSYLIYGLSENIIFWLQANIFLYYGICKIKGEKYE